MNPICLSSIRTLKKKDPVSGVRAVRHEHFKICSTSVELKILYPFKYTDQGVWCRRSHATSSNMAAVDVRHSPFTCVQTVTTTPPQQAGRWGGAAGLCNWTSLTSYLHHHHHPPSTLNYLHCVQCRVVSKRILWDRGKFPEKTKRSYGTVEIKYGGATLGHVFSASHNRKWKQDIYYVLSRSELMHLASVAQKSSVNLKSTVEREEKSNRKQLQAPTQLYLAS